MIYFRVQQLTHASINQTSLQQFLPLVLTDVNGAHTKYSGYKFNRRQIVKRGE